MNELKGLLRPEAATGSGIIIFGLGNAFLSGNGGIKAANF